MAPSSRLLRSSPCRDCSWPWCFATNCRSLTKFSPVIVFYYALCPSLSGFSVKPARSFSSAIFAIFAWIWQDIWVYFAAPCPGMVAAAVLYIPSMGSQRVCCAKLCVRERTLALLDAGSAPNVVGQTSPVPYGLWDFDTPSFGGSSPQPLATSRIDVPASNSVSPCSDVRTAFHGQVCSHSIAKCESCSVYRAQPYHRCVIASSTRNATFEADFDL
jgi:hypothetical protein